MTPGERLQAAKAAKAAQKAAKRGRQAEQVESAFLHKAANVGGWLESHRNLVWGVVAAAVLAGGAAIAWNALRGREAKKAAVLLWDATRAANAQITTSDEPPADRPDVETAPNAAARARTAARRFASVVAKHPETEAATWARIGQGTEQLTLGQYVKARASFERAQRDAKGDPALSWRAIEGIAFAYEGEKRWGDAEREFQRLKRLDGGPFAEIADFHLGRLAAAQGNEADAKRILKGLLKRLSDEKYTKLWPELPYVRQQAELLLGRIEGEAPPSANGDMGNMSPEQIQKLIQQLQEQQGKGAGAAP